MIGSQRKTVRSITATLVGVIGVCTVFPLLSAHAQTIRGSFSPGVITIGQDSIKKSPVVKPKPATQATSRADSLYLAARAAMGKDPAASIKLFHQLIQRYPKHAHIASALYFRGFLLYRQYVPGKADTPLRDAMADLQKLQRQYPSSSQAADALTLQNRICGELGQRGDRFCRKQVTTLASPTNIPHTATITGGTLSIGGTSFDLGGSRSSAATKTAPPPKEPEPPRPPLVIQFGSDYRVERDTTCHNTQKVESYSAALNSLWKVDSTSALQSATSVLVNRDRCLIRLREQTLLMIMQRPTPVLSLTPIIFDVARNDPDSSVKNLATMWLLSQEWDDATAKLFHTIFGQSFRVKAIKTAAEKPAKVSAGGKRE